LDIGLVPEENECLQLARTLSKTIIIRWFDASTGYHLRHYGTDMEVKQ
jgi:hypothetical protein